MKPAFCCFGVIEECFLRCKMCEKWKPDLNIQGIKRPSVEQWKAAVASLRKFTDKNFLINFGGGEALLMDGVLEIIGFAADKGFWTNVASNGYLIDEVMARRIAASGLASINISLDSMNEATHDYLRGVQGVFKQAMKAIEYLDKYCHKNFEIIICCAIYNINMEEVLSVAEWVNNHPRIKWVYFMAAMQPNNTPQNPQWYKDEFKYLWPEDKIRISSVIDSLLEMKSRGYKINNQACQLEAFKKYFNNPERFVKDSFCNLDCALHISSVGNIYLCYEWASLGNITKDDLAVAWYSKEADNVRKNIKDCRKNCHHLINCFFEGDYPFKMI